MPLLELSILKIHSFPPFSLSCFDILTSNFAYDFVSPYFRSSSSVVNLRQFLWELCPFWNLEYWKYTVFRTCLLHALTYWAEILLMTLFYCTIDQVWVSSIFVGVMPLLELRILIIQFTALFSYMLLIYWAEILHMTLFNRTTDQVRLSSIFVNFCRSYAPFGTKNDEIYSLNFRTFLLHALTCWAEILHMTLFYCTSDQV